MIQQVPYTFQPTTKHEYPKYNKIIFEEWFRDYFIDFGIKTDRIYLPILWTNFYIGRKYGTAAMKDLQDFLNSLDKTKSYFTILQYDDGILQNIDGLDILIFGAGGGGKGTVSEANLGFPIPLLCQPNPYAEKDRKRDILCSFVGTIKNHPIRRKILDLYYTKYVIKDSIGYTSFVDIMERSVFSLCPRGYGATSFRICEALQHGSIPVYVYDKPWVPFGDEFDFTDIGLLIHESEIQNIGKIIESKTKKDIEQYVENGRTVYENYFTYTGCAEAILNILT